MRLTLRTMGIWLTDVLPNLRTAGRLLYNCLPSYFHDTPAKIIAGTFAPGVPFFFVNIGANDGVAGDPLVDLIRNNHRCRGLFVEPVSFLFKRLRKNYQFSERFIFENVAIDEYNGVRKFYYLDRNQLNGGNNLPEWSEEIGSFDKSHIARHFPALDASQVLSSDVECVTLPALLERNNVRHVDLLVIDVEGHELVVLNQIDFRVIRPNMILFEHKHLSDADFNAAKSILRGNDYQITQFGRDTLAKLNDKSDSASPDGKDRALLRKVFRNDS